MHCSAVEIRNLQAHQLGKRENSRRNCAEWIIPRSWIYNENGNKLDESSLLVPITDVEVLDDLYFAGLQVTGR